ncbi:MAG: shikimate dehydrogenase [Luteolibacter sp.]
MPDVFTLDDLISRERLDAGAEKPARLAIIGHPVSHSFSPQMHQPALDALGIDARYIRLDIEPGRISEAFARLRALGFIGCNVTVPNKIEALETCGEVHPDARSLGAVNTVRFDADTTRGFNTDGPGFVRAISEEFGESLSTLKVAIVGAGGGAGQAIATQCALQGVERLIVVNRSVDKLGPLVSRLNAVGPTTKVVALSFDDEDLSAHLRDSDLIVNTTSVGLKADDPSILSETCLRRGQKVYDSIYLPAVTPLLELAQRMNCQIGNGLSLLLHQGILAFQLWFPDTNPQPYMREAIAAKFH